MLKKIISLSLLTLTLTLSSPVVAKDNTGLSNSQLNKLKSLGIPIILPAYAPSGFKISNVEAVIKKYTGPGTGSPAGENNYIVTYSKKLKSGRKSEFFIETVTWGIGDLMQSTPIKVKTKLGDAFIHVDSVSEGNNLKLTNCIDMEWLTYNYNKGSFNNYRISSGSGCAGKDDGSSLRVSKEDAIKIIQSLKVIDTGKQNKPKTSVKHKVSSLPMTGTYKWGSMKTGGGVLAVQQVNKEKINFEIVGYRGAPSFSAGKASGEAYIINGAGTFQHPGHSDCKISFGFLGNKVIVTETAYGFDCGFGNNASVEGTYTKTSNQFKSIEYP